jgi:hypothetical protein
LNSESSQKKPEVVSEQVENDDDDDPEIAELIKFKESSSQFSRYSMQSNASQRAMDVYS